MVLPPPPALATLKGILKRSMAVDPEPEPEKNKEPAEAAAEVPSALKPRRPLHNGPALKLKLPPPSKLDDSENLADLLNSVTQEAER